MKYTVNDEGVSALRTMSTAITDSVEKINGLTKNAQSMADENADTLGPHVNSLNSALSEIESSIKDASEPAESISERLDEAADSYESIIENDRLSGSAGK